MIYRNKHIVNTYANRFRTEWTNTDVRIRFGEIILVSPGQKVITDERVSVTMTWTTLKDFRDAIDVLLNKYESINGEIVETRTFSLTDEDDSTGPEVEPAPEDEADSPPS